MSINNKGRDSRLWDNYNKIWEMVMKWVKEYGILILNMNNNINKTQVK